MTKLGTYLDLKRIWNPIDFQGQGSRSQGLIFRRGDTPRFALPLLYPLQEVAKELIEGLRFGFKLKYTGTRLPVLTKNSNSVSEHNEVVCRKINKEITMGRVDGPFNHSPMPTPRISPIFLTTKSRRLHKLEKLVSDPYLLYLANKNTNV